MKLTTDDKIFLRSIEILAQTMVNDDNKEDREKTAQTIKDLLEDYIKDKSTAR